MIRKAALLLMLLQLAACGGGDGGSTPPPSPSGLSYPTPPTYTVGVAITALTPTVTGTVTSYAVSPGLPAGLALNASSGVISGTPRAVSAATTYTVTASNGTGSTTADVSITVVAAAAAPMVSFPSLTYSLTAGGAASIAPVSTGGAVSTWSVSPALPAGLTLNAETGTITGTPTTVSLPASYVVTAENSRGTYKIGLTLQVVSKVLLDLGHNGSITQLLFSGTRLLSQGSGAIIDEAAVARCNLWNTATDKLVAEFECTGQTTPFALAGPTAVIVGPTPSVNGLAILASSTGALEGKVTAPFSWWQLASDGSYIVTGSATSLNVFSPSGQTLYSAAGNYATAKAFAAPGQVLIALGPAGANVIQTVTIPGGVVATGPAFMGTFNEWFSDGSHFQTTVGTSVYTYTSASARVDLTVLSTVQGLAGEGNYFWIVGAATPLTIYTVGASSTPALVVSGGPVYASGSTIGLLGPSAGQLTIVDLSGASPVQQTYTLPAAVSSGIFAAISASDWFVGGGNGVIFDGTSIATTPKYLDYGTALSVAGGAGVAAVATALGIVVINVQTNTIELTIPVISNNVQLSADATVLAASQSDGSALNVYSLPSGSLINSFPYTAGGVISYTLAPTGTLIAQFTAPVGAGAITQQVTAVTGGPVLWSETQTPPYQALESVQFSQDGTLIAASNGDPDAVNSTQQANIGTNIYKNYVLAEAVPGWAVGWISNTELLTNTYTYSPQNSPIGTYAGATIYSPTGTAVATPALPQLRSLVPVNAEGTEIYSPSLNSIYAIPSGSLVFGSSYYKQSGLSGNTPAGFASPDMVYVWGSHVVAVQPPQ
jgi:Putative Ig domain